MAKTTQRHYEGHASAPALRPCPQCGRTFNWNKRSSYTIGVDGEVICTRKSCLDLCQKRILALYGDQRPGWNPT